MLQACRGGHVEEEAPTEFDAGAINSTAKEEEPNCQKNEDDYEDGVKTVTPAGADFLVCYATAEGRRIVVVLVAS